MADGADKPLVLVDGSSYLYRAFHAMPELTNSAGQPTGALLGVLNMVYKLLDEQQPERMAVVFDAPGRTFRDDLFEAYKANRPPMPDDLGAQIEPLIEALEKSGIPVVRVAGVEADDVIGTLAVTAAKAGQSTLISTSDKDMAQLVNGHITLIDTMPRPNAPPPAPVDAERVKAKYGVGPDRIIDYLALVGDTSDNIPGVKGVGPKTASKWLEQYGSLDALLEHVGEIGGKVGDNLRAAVGEIPLYRELATIRCDCELPVGLEDLKLAPPDYDALRVLFASLELNSLARRRLPKVDGADDASAAAGEGAPRKGVAAGDAGGAAGDGGVSAAGRDARVAAEAASAARPAEPPRDYELVLTEAQLDAWIDRITAARLVGFDTETDGLDYMRSQLVGLSFATEDGRAAYVPVDHRYPGAPEQLGRDAVLARLKPWLESDATAKVGHHLKFDIHVLSRYGIRLRGVRFDTMLESYVLNSVATRHDMDSVAARYLGLQTIRFEDVCGKGAKQITFDQLDLENACRYAAEDADVALRIHRELWPRLEAEPKLATLYTELEQPLVHVLRAMEQTGVKVDARMLQTQSSELAAAMADKEAAAHAEAGGPFNIGSPKQLQEVLYERLGLPVLGKTPSGQPSTAENVLQQLAETYDLPRLILEYRGLSKLKSTYTDKLPKEINPQTGRVHTSYHQAVAATGRLSSTDPNLQNIPIRTAEGRRIRQAFIAESGCRLVAADYSQIELRIMAHLSGDEGLRAAFEAGDDIHRATAAEVFNVPLGDVSAELRRSAKAINFGLIYGMSAFGLARQLGVERGEAQRYIELYFKRYPGVKRYMDETRERAREQGYVETVFGRRLYLPEIRERNAARRQYAERSAINAPMQGTAADIIKRAMLEIHAWLTAEHPEARLIMQVHDELVLEVPEALVVTVSAEVAARMEQAAELSVPLKAEVGVGLNWDEAH